MAAGIKTVHQHGVPSLVAATLNVEYQTCLLCAPSQVLPVLGRDKPNQKRDGSTPIGPLESLNEHPFTIYFGGTTYFCVH